MTTIAAVRAPAPSAAPSPLPVASPIPADRPAAPPAPRFADMLRRQAPAPTPAAPPATGASAVESPKTASPEDAPSSAAPTAAVVSSQRDAAQAKARATGAARPAAAPAKASKADSEAGEDTADENDPARIGTPMPQPGTTPTVHPAVPLPEARRCSAGPRAGADAASRATDVVDAGAASSPMTRPSIGAAGSLAEPVQAEAGAARFVPVADAPARAAPEGGDSTKADASLATSGDAGTTFRLPEPPPPSTAHATPAAAAASDPAPVAAASVAVPVDAPEFAAAVGVSVRVLVEAGIEAAELHLNPAEMGPVSIAIAIDGSRARVEFGADVAATRQAIEAGLPELASALRDAGFTLAGGGVSDQAARGRDGQRGGDDASPRPTAVPARADAAVEAAARVRLPRAVAGGIDLYA